MVAIRYIVEDAERALTFYRDLLGFRVDMSPAPGFAVLSRGHLQLFLNEPGAGGAGRAGGSPEPGGWNRFRLEVQNLEATVDRLQRQGARFRGEAVTGKGGLQILVEDPSGNAIELFQPARDAEGAASSAERGR